MARVLHELRWMAHFALALGVVMGLGAQGVARADPLARNTDRALGLTPPMGFNNWARFQCLAQAPLDQRDQAGYSFQDFMLDQAAALTSSGLARAGYRTVVVDDCWMRRNSAGALEGNPLWGSFKKPSAQPGFDRDLTLYMRRLHELGLLGGVYNTAGRSTCQGVEAGEAGHQRTDAAQLAAWGVDFLKLDNCGASDDDLPRLFRDMAEALGQATTGRSRKILFDESAPAQYAPADPMKYKSMVWVRSLGQMWRVAPDIRIAHLGADERPLYDPWSFNDAAQGYEEGVYQSFTDTIALSRYVAPGAWNDADQLLIGDGGMTTAEERSQMGLWAMMAAPLFLSADVRALARHRDDPRIAASLAILTNPAVTAIDQDPLGAGGYLVMRDHSADDMGVDIVLRPLSGGAVAVLILNKNPEAIDYRLPLDRLGLGRAPCLLRLTDVWSGAQSATDLSDALFGHIQPHDNLLFRIEGPACLALTPTGQIMAAQAEFAASPLCLEAGAEGRITIESCTANPRQQWRRERDGHIRLAGAAECLAATARGAVASHCGDSPAQRFAYHLSGALTDGAGACLAVETGKVGHGGLIGQQGARVVSEPCRLFAAEQTFSAPHLAAPP